MPRDNFTLGSFGFGFFNEQKKKKRATLTGELFFTASRTPSVFVLRRISDVSTLRCETFGDMGVFN